MVNNFVFGIYTGSILAIVNAPGVEKIYPIILCFAIGELDLFEFAKFTVCSFLVYHFFVDGFPMYVWTWIQNQTKKLIEEVSTMIKEYLEGKSEVPEIPEKPEISEKPKAKPMSFVLANNQPPLVLEEKSELDGKDHTNFPMFIKEQLLYV